MEKRFRALRTIGTLFKIFAWIELVVVILLAILIVIGGSVGSLDQALGQELPRIAVGGVLGAIVTGGVILLAGVVYFLLLYATAEGIYVILSIEENTRLTAVAMSGRSSM